MVDSRDDGNGRTLAEVTNGIVALQREYYGRGATTARTFMSGRYLVCFMEDIYTTGERTLIDAGEFDAVLHARATFQEIMRERFSEVVERETGRKVVGFLSQSTADPDASLEAFILADGDGDGAAD
jgi:uncharacterized protein YbcI